MKVSGHVHYNVGADGGIVLLDARTGRWYVLNAVGAELWRSLSRGHGLAESVAVVATRHAGVPQARLHADAHALRAELVRLGLILPKSAPSSPRAPAPHRSDPVIAAAAPAVAHGAGREIWLRIAAALILLIAVVLVRLPFGRLSRLIRWTRRWARRPLTGTGADLLATAVVRSAAWFPGRAACLELSLATVLLAAVRRRRLDWCLGARPDPYRFHAWVESDGRLVRLPGDADLGDYVTVLTI
ncbi:MAG TPA: lasso peptide biosynthesis B2 protein [Streptosporangiaceae bacterium]|nr:lasso peptide biosynthesis B2 protein [Streptosporangiaceae bacterium]